METYDAADWLLRQKARLESGEISRAEFDELAAHFAEVFKNLGRLRDAGIPDELIEQLLKREPELH